MSSFTQQILRLIKYNYYIMHGSIDFIKFSKFNTLQRLLSNYFIHLHNNKIFQFSEIIILVIIIIDLITIIIIIILKII
jgi:hypothetical protein